MRTPIVNKGNSPGNPPWQVSVGTQYDFQAFDHNVYMRGDWQYTGKSTIKTAAEDATTLNRQAVCP